MSKENLFEVKQKKEAFVINDSQESAGVQHQPVLCREAIAGLIVEKNGVYVDATFGRGGHSRRILQHIDSQGTLICIDKDHEAIQEARKLNDKRLIIRQGSFTKLKEWIQELNLSGKINGILLDLGVSSPQLDDASRGFSFLRDGPLDMRMDQSQPVDAAMWLRNAKESEIAKVLREYGEERFSKRIAHAIVKERMDSPIVTTKRLAEIVSLANPSWEKNKHPATRTFQAIRIFINNELQELAECLEQSLDVLAVGGRLVIISFHSLEDQIIKKFIQKYTGGAPGWLPVHDLQLLKRLQRVGRTIHASSEEVSNNPRARSAVLKVYLKIR